MISFALYTVSHQEQQHIRICKDRIWNYVHSIGRVLQFLQFLNMNPTKGSVRFLFAYVILLLRSWCLKLYRELLLSKFYFCFMLTNLCVI
jgi:hypothetical protein